MRSAKQTNPNSLNCAIMLISQHQGVKMVSSWLITKYYRLPFRIHNFECIKAFFEGLIAIFHVRIAHISQKAHHAILTSSEGSSIIYKQHSVSQHEEVINITHKRGRYHTMRTTMRPQYQGNFLSSNWFFRTNVDGAEPYIFIS